MSAQQITALKERAKLNTPAKSRGVNLFIHFAHKLSFHLFLKHIFMTGRRRLLPLDYMEDQEHLL